MQEFAGKSDAKNQVGKFRSGGRIILKSIL
jgi:hypothetical protein